MSAVQRKITCYSANCSYEQDFFQLERNTFNYWVDFQYTFAGIYDYSVLFKFLKVYSSEL